MNPEHDSEAARFGAAFVLRYFRDLEEGRSVGLSEYQSLFSGHEALIALEWDRLHSANKTIKAQSTEHATGTTSRIGPYRIDGEIARGGQAIVLAATDTRLDRPVALKILRAGQALSETALLRFQAEARVLAGLEHPAICPIYEARTESGHSYLALARISGTTLAKRIAERRKELPALPTREEIAAACAFVEETARGLHAAHEWNVIHRDLKPGNIMVTTAGRPVILDFGLARLIDAGADRLTRTGDVLGTPAYLSPEQLAGDRDLVDRGTDVHALGLVLHEMVTLRRAFGAEDREELLRQIREQSPASARTLNPAISRDLELVIATATRKEPALRYRTAKDLAEDLRCITSGQPVLARRIGALATMAILVRRHPAVSCMVLVVLLVLASALAVGFLESRRIRNARKSLAHETEAVRSATQATEERLREFHRMDDLVRLEELIATEPTLHPSHPVVIPQVEAWLTAARGLMSRSPGHRIFRDALRLRAREFPPEPPHFVAGGDDPDGMRWRALRTLDAIAAERRRGPTTERTNTLDRREAETLAGIRSLEASGAGRPRVVLSNAEDQWLFDSLDHLVAGLDYLGGTEASPGLIAAVESRRERALALPGLSTEGRDSAWAAAAAAIAGDERFEGLRLTPQMGLVPLGADSGSGLQEFAHVSSGAVPSRGADGYLNINDHTAIVLVLIPGRTFRMGADTTPTPAENSDPRADADEAPVHKVTLEPFFLSKFEMTQAQWIAWTGSNPSQYPTGSASENHRPTPRCPVEQASWSDAERVLFEMGLCLPTEAQWECGARAGTSTPWWTGPESASVLGAGNFADAWLKAHGGVPGWIYDEAFNDGWSGPAPVGTFRPNAFGLHDTIGNVHEWCRDRFEPYSQPTLPGEGLRVGGNPRRVFRGGSFCTDLNSARTANRIASMPSTGQHDVGFRPARRLDRP